MSLSFLKRAPDTKLDVIFSVRSASLSGVVVCALWPLSAFAQVEPRLEVETGFWASSDPFLLSGKGRGAVMVETAISPSLHIETDRGSTVVARGTVRQRDYLRKYGHFTLGEAGLEANYRESEYLTLGITGGFERALALDAQSNGIEAAIEPSALRQSWEAGLRAEWRPNAYQLITPEFRYEQLNFPGSELLVPSKSYAFGLAYSLQTGPRTRIGLRLRDLIRRSDRMSDLNTIALYATIARRLGERGSISAELGAERAGTQREQFGSNTTTRSPRTLLAGSVRLCREATPPRGYVGQRLADRPSSAEGQWFGCLSGGLNTEVTGLGGLRRDATLAATISRPLNENFTLRGEGEYRRSTLVGGSGNDIPVFDYGSRAEIVRTAVDLDWRVHRDITMTGRAQYIRRQIVTGNRVGATFFGIQLRYTPGSSR